MDDFSKAVWVYTLKGKDDVYDSITNFVQMISTQFETNIKTFRSDNGTEFVNNRLQTFFNSKGFLHLYNHDKFSSRPNDEGIVFSNDDGTKLSPDVNEGNDDSGATSMDETNNTHPEGTVPNETDFINDFYKHSELNSDVEELPANTIRRSFRHTKLPSSLNEFIIEGKVKYDVERVVNYANLSHANHCFIFALNKNIEPTCYEEAVLDSNWIDVMNAEIEALNEN
ncbi:ribonuclease H-like domain-containing protein [Tanacetum coccineum]